MSLASLLLVLVALLGLVAHVVLELLDGLCRLLQLPQDLVDGFALELLQIVDLSDLTNFRDNKFNE